MIGAFNDIQEDLTKVQALPLIGMAFSPVKAVVSVAQVVSGVTASFFLTCLGIFAANRALLDFAEQVLIQNAREGISNLFYAIANLATFTIAGFCFESSRAKKLNLT